MLNEMYRDFQRRLYQYIVKYMESEGMAPTEREIGYAFDIATKRDVCAHLALLQEEGLILWNPNGKRGIRLA